MKYKKSTKEKEVFSYENAKGHKLWMFRHKYYDGLTGKRKEKKKSGFKTEKAAIKALLEVKAQTLRGNTKTIENENITVGAWLDTWFETNQRSWSKKTIVQREIAIRLQMKPLLGHYKLQKLDKATYQKAFINVLEDQYAPSMVRSLHTLFKIAVNAAVEEELIDRNRFTRIKFSKKEETNNNYLTPQQLVEFLHAAEKHESITNYTMLLLIAYTGMRAGEACGLKWKDIDFKSNTISIMRSRGQYGVGTTKTKNSERTIPVDKIVIEQLRKYRIWCKKTLLSFGKTKTVEDEEAFIFISQYTGEPFIFHSTSIMRRVLKHIGVSGVTLHGLRHTHATILLNDGLPVKVIANRLGNTPQMIHTVYGHILKEMEQRAVAAFSDSLKTVGAKTGAKK